MIAMHVREAVTRLRYRFSDEDPITHAGTDKSPRDLEYDLWWDDDAATTRVEYWSGTRNRTIRGTLSGMVHDRERDLSIEPDTCPNCGRAKT